MQTKFDVDERVNVSNAKILDVIKNENGVFYRTKVYTSDNKSIELVFEEDQLSAIETAPENETTTEPDPTDP